MSSEVKVGSLVLLKPSAIPTNYDLFPNLQQGRAEVAFFDINETYRVNGVRGSRLMLESSQGVEFEWFASSVLSVFEEKKEVTDLVHVSTEVIEAELVDESAIVVQGFDYNQLPVVLRDRLRECTQDIKKRLTLTAEAISDIGRKLLEVKEFLPHGSFEAWLEAEFEWSVRQARNFMSVGKVFQIGSFADLKISSSALYELAAASTPEEAREQAIDLARAGEKISYTRAKEIIKQCKSPASSVPIQPKGNRVPAAILDRVGLCFQIDLDPVFDDPHVQSRFQFFPEDEPLKRRWKGTVFLHIDKDVDAYVEKLLYEHTEGEVSEAIAYLPAETQSDWFPRLRYFLRCFLTASRVEPEPAGAWMVVYLGDDPAEFCTAFGDIGDCFSMVSVGEDDL